jgi:hypothetical protein
MSILTEITEAIATNKVRPVASRIPRARHPGVAYVAESPMFELRRCCRDTSEATRGTMHSIDNPTRLPDCEIRDALFPKITARLQAFMHLDVGSETNQAAEQSRYACGPGALGKIPISRSYKDCIAWTSTSTIGGMFRRRGAAATAPETTTTSMRRKGSETKFAGNSRSEIP